MMTLDRITGLPPGAVCNALGWYLADWSDFELRLVIDFEPFTIRLGKKRDRTATIRPVFSWKRGRQVVTINRRPSIGLSTEAKHWARATSAQLRDQWSVMPGPIPAGIEINAAIVSYLRNAALVDSSNLYQGPEDIMQACKTGKRPCKPGCRVHAAVIVDDKWIRTHNGSDRLIDRARSRVELTLTPYAPGSARAHPVQEELDF